MSRQSDRSRLLCFDLSLALALVLASVCLFIPTAFAVASFTKASIGADWALIKGETNEGGLPSAVSVGMFRICYSSPGAACMPFQWGLSIDTSGFEGSDAWRDVLPPKMVTQVWPVVALCASSFTFLAAFLYCRCTPMEMIWLFGLLTFLVDVGYLALLIILFIVLQSRISSSTPYSPSLVMLPTIFYAVAFGLLLLIGMLSMVSIGGREGGFARMRIIINGGGGQRGKKGDDESETLKEQAAERDLILLRLLSGIVLNREKGEADGFTDLETGELSETELEAKLVLNGIPLKQRKELLAVFKAGKKDNSDAKGGKKDGMLQRLLKSDLFADDSTVEQKIRRRRELVGEEDAEQGHPLDERAIRYQVQRLREVRNAARRAARGVGRNWFGRNASTRVRDQEKVVLPVQTESVGATSQVAPTYFPEKQFPQPGVETMAAPTLTTEASSGPYRRRPASPSVMQDAGEWVQEEEAAPTAAAYVQPPSPPPPSQRTAGSNGLRGILKNRTPLGGQSRLSRRIQPSFFGRTPTVSRTNPLHRRFRAPPAALPEDQQNMMPAPVAPSTFVPAFLPPEHQAPPVPETYATGRVEPPSTQSGPAESRPSASSTARASPPPPRYEDQGPPILPPLRFSDPQQQASGSESGPEERVDKRESGQRDTVLMEWK